MVLVIIGTVTGSDETPKEAAATAATSQSDASAPAPERWTGSWECVGKIGTKMTINSRYNADVRVACEQFARNYGGVKSLTQASPEKLPPAVKTDERSGYKVVHVLPRQGREDRYYLLMDPVDLSSAAFKSNVKAIITELVSEHGPLYIEFHDSLKSLTTSYKQYGDLSLGRNRTAAEDAEQERHYIAQYLGGSDHTLSFFPASTSGSPGVGRYVDCCGTFEP